jgi:hypothetical protein
VIPLVTFLQFILYFGPLILVIVDVRKRKFSKYWILGSILLPIIVPYIYWYNVLLSKKRKSVNHHPEKRPTPYNNNPVYPTLQKYQAPMNTVNTPTVNKNTSRKNNQNKGTPLRSFRTYVAGTKFKNADGSSRQEILESCLEGDELILVRELDNKHDPNAVKVCTFDGDQIGYLPAHIAQEIAPRLDKGSPVDAELVELRDSDEWITYCTVEITKYRMR